MKIRHKLTLGFVGLALLMATIGYVALHTSRTTIEGAIGKSSADLAEQVLDKIYRNIYRRVEEIQVLATDELAQEHLPLSNAQFENMADPNGYIEQVETDWTCESNELTPVMVQLTTNKLACELQSRKNFYQNKYGYPLLGEIFVTNRFGANVALTNKTTDYYQADEDWWQIARRDGLFVSDVRYDESSGTFSTEIAVRIDDAKGNFVGVIKAVPNIKETIDIINEAKLTAEYKTMQLHLVNKDAKIIYSTKGYSFLQDAANQLTPRFGHFGRSEHKCYIIGKKAGDKGTLFAHAHSQKHKDFAGLGWSMVTETSTAEIFAPIVNLRNTMLLAGLAVMGLALLASSITYRSVVIPIAELQKATVQIASGNLDMNLTTSASDEIGQLANSFQRMATQLKKTISDLSDEVNGRKMTEEKLSDNQQFLSNVFDGIQDGICVLDKDLNIIKVNAYNEKIRSDAMPLVGKKCYEAYHQLHSPCPWCPSTLTLKTGKQHTAVVAVPSENNPKWWMEISAFPLKDCSGHVTGVIEHVRDITERKHTEDSLRESEARLKTILDNIQTGVFIIDPETHKIVYANPVAAKLTGTSQKQLVGSMCHNYICTAEKGQCPITDLGQQVDNAERVLLTVKGEKCPIIKTVVTIMLDGRKHLLESFVDATEHKKAEQALKLSEQRFSQVVENAREWVWEINTDGLYIYASPVVKEILGFSPEEIVGKKYFYDLFHPEDRETLKKAAYDTFAKKAGFQRLINRNLHKDGRVVWLSTSAMPIFDEQENVVGYRGVDADITEQRKAETILTERTEQIMHHHNTLLKMANMPEEDFDSLLRTTTEQDADVLDVEQVGVWFFNQNRTEIVCRDLFIRTKKVHENGESLKVLDYPHYFKTLENSRIVAANNALTDLRTCEFADIYLKLKGVTSMIDVPIRLHGRIVGIICHEHIGPAREWTSAEQDFAASVADMISLKLEATERIKVEQSLEKLNKDLEAAVAELSRSNRQLQDFVHIAAHDLKTPVRGIGTLADWIISDYGSKLDEHGREQVHLLKARVVRIDKLIDGMLLFSKITRTRQNERQTNLNMLLSELTKEMYIHDNIDIAVDSLPGITCEPEHITQVFQSLLSNAVNFMDKPKGLIKVGCVEQGNFWKFYICDNGPGIEQRYFEKIFRIFQTLPKKDEPETAGIGLAIAKKIVEIYGGKIWVESQPGVGSTFFFTFPKQKKESVYANTKANTAC